MPHCLSLADSCRGRLTASSDDTRPGVPSGFGPQLCPWHLPRSSQDLLRGANGWNKNTSHCGISRFLLHHTPEDCCNKNRVQAFARQRGIFLGAAGFHRLPPGILLLDFLCLCTMHRLVDFAPPVDAHAHKAACSRSQGRNVSKRNQQGRDLIMPCSQDYDKQVP
jgi:hypothetical protein